MTEFKLTVYKTLTGDFEDFSEVEAKQFNTLKQAEKYADNVYWLSPVVDLFPNEYTNSGDTIGTIESF